MRRGIVSLLILSSITLHAETDFDREQIQQRISPIGQVSIEGASATANKPTPPPAQAVAKKEPGQATYEQYCVVCHKDGVAGAPKFRDATNWKPRVDQKKIDGLTASAIKGLNAMPPKGTCSSCSEADIKAAIEYMVPKS